MSRVAILGAGAIGAATAHRLAQRARIGEIQLIDASVDVARGKALDIQQSGPVERFEARLSASDDVLAAAGAAIIVVADTVTDDEWSGDRGLTLLSQLSRAGTVAPIVFAGPSQFELMEAAYRSLKIAAHRLVGSAASAVVGAVQAIAGVELNLASAELTVVGRPPSFVIGWSAASASGSLLADRIQAHRLLAISQSMSRLWPPGPHAIASATAQLVEALIFGSRRLHPALTILDGELGARGVAVMLPLELGRLRVLSYVVPSLSQQEKTALVNGLRT